MYPARFYPRVSKRLPVALPSPRLCCAVPLVCRESLRGGWNVSCPACLIDYQGHNLVAAIRWWNANRFHNPF